MIALMAALMNVLGFFSIPIAPGTAVTFASVPLFIIAIAYASNPLVAVVAGFLGSFGFGAIGWFHMFALFPLAGVSVSLLVNKHVNRMASMVFSSMLWAVIVNYFLWKIPLGLSNEIYYIVTVKSLVQYVFCAFIAEMVVSEPRIFKMIRPQAVM
jgi:hypothetical protein